MPRLKYHFEPQKGWLNDPNGLIYFKGKYHAFFQHNPHDVVWGPMYWGHAVSDDLITWEELPIALSPDMPYEDKGGCWSGSAMIKDDRLYLFYTAVSEAMGQTQCMAYSDDGISFTKYENNPIIDHFPDEGSGDFRDPKIILIGDTYNMVVGSGKDGVGKVLRYTSKDLFDWNYEGVLYEDHEYTHVIECPDFFELDGKFVLVFSIYFDPHARVVVAVGSFDGKAFTPEHVYLPERGPNYYASQSFLDKDGERVSIAWMHRKMEKPTTEQYMGALSIPRMLHVKGNKLYSYPVSAAQKLLTDSDPLVRINESGVEIAEDFIVPLKSTVTDIKDVKILRDTKTIEVFINGGEESFTYWFDKK